VTGLILGVRVSRLYEKGWRENPECLKGGIRQPLIVMGVPRSGTTVMQRLRLLDPRSQGSGVGWPGLRWCVRRASGRHAIRFPKRMREGSRGFHRYTLEDLD
jgi:hypothetical protein